MSLTIHRGWIEFVTCQQNAFLALLVDDDVRLRRDLEGDVQVHNVHDQVQLAKVDLVFQQRVAVSRHLDIEFVFHILGNFGVLESLQVLHRFKDRNIVLVMGQELAFVRV